MKTLFDDMPTTENASVFDDMKSSRGNRMASSMLKPYTGALEVAAQVATGLPALSMAGIAGLATTIASGPGASAAVATAWADS